ncbi:ATP-binding protein [Halobellus sp. GM3]|uniref:ATP-binding protein n=1 Tax=Halobellus sp. GM3 TaxID=3458410 RepID=UPI00403DA68B
MSSAEPDFRSLIDYLDGIAIWIVSEPEEFEYISAGAEGIWGISAEAIQNDPSALLDRIHPDDLDMVLSYMDTAPEKVSEESYEARAVHPDGTVRWVHTRQIPVRDSDGTLRRIVGICTDITDQKRREQEFEALNRVLRHDIRNDLGILLGWGEFLEQHVDEEGEELLEKVLSAADHVVELTEIARDYAETIASGTQMDTKPVSLRASLEQEVELRREFFPQSEFRIVGDIPDVEVIANEMLSSVFRNLLNNAVQHNDTDEPVVEVSGEVRDESVVVHIADNGPGIPPEMRDSLFKEGRKGIDSSGTGIGLYLVKTLLEQYNGAIDVTDNSPKGSVFHVEFAQHR